VTEEKGTFFVTEVLSGVDHRKQYSQLIAYYFQNVPLYEDILCQGIPLFDFRGAVEIVSGMNHPSYAVHE
jgi:hypothetical protein